MTSIQHSSVSPAITPRRIQSGIGFPRIALTTIAVAFLTLFVIVPAANVFAQALSNGWQSYRDVFFPPPIDQARLAQIEARLDEINSLPLLKRRAFNDERRLLMREQSAILALPDSARQNWASVRLTLCIAAVVVPLNIFFGVAFAWSVTKFKFKGRSLLIAITELPFSVSPVVSGLIFVLLFGAQGFLADVAKSDRAVWLAPGDSGLLWLPPLLLAGWSVLLASHAALVWFYPELKEREPFSLKVRRIVRWASLLVFAAIVIYAYTQPNPGWALVAPHRLEVA